MTGRENSVQLLHGYAMRFAMMLPQMLLLSVSEQNCCEDVDSEASVCRPELLGAAKEDLSR